MDNKRKIAVVGAGSWATAIVKILLNNTEHINWWVREEEVRDGILQNGRNPLYLSDVCFDAKRIHISTDIKEIVAASDVIILVVPAAFVVDSMSVLTAADFVGKRVCSAIKGIIPQSNEVVGEFLNREYEIPLENLSIISGPSHAEEIALEKLTYLTSASRSLEMAEDMATLFNCSYVQTTISDDFFGIEYATVLKNIYAIAIGICKGLGYGDNFRAVMVSNALQEMQRFVADVHDIDRQMASSVYLGDLLVTAYSQFSRNRTFGTMIGRGYSVRSAQLEMKMIAEGYFASKCVHIINEKYKVNMPIMEAVYSILYENQPPKVEFKKLIGVLN